MSTNYGATTDLDRANNSHSSKMIFVAVRVFLHTGLLLFFILPLFSQNISEKEHIDETAIVLGQIEICKVYTKFFTRLNFQSNEMKEVRVEGLA